MNGQTKDTAAVLQVLTHFIDAWNQHNAQAFGRVFAEDADFMNVAGKSLRGRTSIEQHHAPSFTTKWKDSHQKITQHTIRFVRPDVAAVDAWWELTGIKGAEGQEMPPRKGILSFIITKEKGSWLLTVMHNLELKE